MSTFSLTDNFNNPVTAPVNWTSRSALFKYLKSEALHLVVFPDFLQHKDQLIGQITPQPLQAQLKVGYKFQLAGANPETDVTPQAQIAVEVNARAGSNLFDDDQFASSSIRRSCNNTPGSWIRSSRSTNVTSRGRSSAGSREGVPSIRIRPSPTA